MPLPILLKRWRFKNEESALRFAIAVLSLTNQGELTSREKDGSNSIFKPSPTMLKKVASDV